MVLIPFLNKGGEIREWMYDNIWLAIVCLVLILVTEIMIICCRSVGRKVPLNFIVLGLFTICESYLVSMIASRYSPDIVLGAMFMTAAITLGISVYACTTKSDFTIMGGALFMFGFGLMMFGLFAIIFWSRVLYMIYCILIVFLFGFYLLFDTQLIMGGKRYEISEEDYILGAFILYADIIIIFIYLLRILGGNGSN